jgi:hypothetical protein
MSLDGLMTPEQLFFIGSLLLIVVGVVSWIIVLYCKR